MKKLVILFIFLFGLQILHAQEANQKTSQIQINVLTESMERTNQPQQLLVEINKNTIETPENLSITIDGIESVFTLVSARRNNENLWLINATSPAANEKVLAWNFDKENKALILYPFEWNATYILELDIQVNLEKPSSVERNSSAIVLSTEINGTIYDANPTGRGNNIQIRE